jgi:hypothetical protein
MQIFEIKFKLVLKFEFPLKKLVTYVKYVMADLVQVCVILKRPLFGAVTDLLALTFLVFQVLWKAFVDFEIGQEEYDNARDLYQRLLQRTKHVKVRIFV